MGNPEIVLITKNKKRFEDVANYLMINKEINEETFKQQFNKAIIV